MNSNGFNDLGFSEETLKTINQRGFEEPTEIQAKAIPVLLNEDTDIIGQAQTGTGKTAAFGLPLIEKMEKGAKHIQCLILVPTRELAIQVSDEINSFKGKTKFQIIPVYGGQSMSDQIRRINKNVDVVVGTPGRILDHLKRKTMHLEKVSHVILDEADEMLNMGFIEDVEKILSYTNPDRKTLLFSATMPPQIKAISKKYMKNVKVIATSNKHITADLTDQIYFEISPSDKFEALCRIRDITDGFYGLVFCRTKVGVDELANKLVDRGYNAEGLHGDLSQHQRERVLDKFKKKRINMLIATDVAARGIDVMDLTHVINYSLPQDSESYIHRIGRTGRAGKKGIAITFISPSEYKKLMHITYATKTKIRKEKLPHASEIIKIKQKRLNDELKTIIKEDAHLNYAKTALSLLKDSNPEDVVAALLKYSLEDELDETRYKEIQEKTRVDDSGKARLFVSIGRKDGMEPRKLLKLINNVAGVSSAKIREVKVMESFSFLSVPFEEAEIILREFASNSDGRTPMIQRAKPMKVDPSGKGTKPRYKKKPNK